MQLYFFLYLLTLNVITFLIYALDKWKARHKRWRIPEKTLLLLATLGGSVGALIAMYTIRHKTKHAKFFLGVPVILILQVLLLGWLYVRLGASLL